MNNLEPFRASLSFSSDTNHGLARKAVDELRDAEEMGREIASIRAELKELRRSGSNLFWWGMLGWALFLIVLCWKGMR